MPGFSSIQVCVAMNQMLPQMNAFMQIPMFSGTCGYENFVESKEICASNGQIDFICLMCRVLVSHRSLLNEFSGMTLL